MQTVYLVYFQELVRTLSFAKAAVNLHISQPGLTRAIQSIEQEFGYPLFTRRGNSIYITNEGEKFAEYSRTIVEALDKMKQLNNPANNDFLFNSSDKSILHIVTTSTSFAVMHSLREDRFENWPELRFSELSTTLLLKKLELQKDSDPWLFFVSVPQYGSFAQKIMKRHNLTFTPLLSIRAMAKVANTSPLAKKSVLTKKDLRNVTWAISSDPNLDDILPLVTSEEILDRNIGLRSSHRDLISQAILEKGYIGISNDYAKSITPSDFCIIPFEEVAISQVGFLTRNDLALPSSLCCFKDIVSKKCRTMKQLPW